MGDPEAAPKRSQLYKSSRKIVKMKKKQEKTGILTFPVDQPPLPPPPPLPKLKLYEKPPPGLLGLAPAQQEEKSYSYIFRPAQVYTQLFSRVDIDRTPEEIAEHDFPFVYPYERINAMDMFRYEQSPTILDEWRKKDTYLPLLMPPYTISKGPTADNFAIFTEALKSKKPQNEIDQLRDQILDALANLTHEDLANMAMSLAIDYKYTDKAFWKRYSQVMLEKYVDCPQEQLWKVKYAISKLRPNYASLELRRKLYGRAVECLKVAQTPRDIMLILQAFRSDHKKTLHNLARTAYIERKSDFWSVTEESRRGSMLAEVIYNWGTTMPRHWNVYREANRNGVNEFVAHYEAWLLDHIPNMQTSDIVRLLFGMYMLKTPEYPNIMHAIEKRVVAVKEQLNADQLVDVLKSFSRAQDNCLLGEDKTFIALEPILQTHMASLNKSQLAHCMYAFAIRNQGTKALHNAYEQKLLQDIPQMGYEPLSNVGYYLLMRDIKDRELWKTFIQRTLDVPGVLPLIYHQPFKLCKIFIDGYFTDWDCSAFTGKLWWAEKYKVAPANESLFFSCEEYATFQKFLATQLKIMPTSFFTYENSFQVPFAFPDMRVGIMLYLDRDMVPGTMRINERRLLPGKVLKYHYWEILDISYREFIEMGKPAAEKYLTEWLSLASKLQIEKEVIPAHLPTYL